ncbi:response regulator transcription factor [Paenibacillus graminis]|uniref:response regulator transcription factor n=1 Tax=Paenibacillus graminis TaxID=189425 RepID=UPI000FA1BB15|nr:response regulator transcription factor [Paenibacillus graminis]MEC0168378.1 response regulator transcription factor [Paenibacillus graminis]
MNTILIVDDDICIRELVSTVLQNEGFITFEASNGRDALRKMTDASPDLCVIDLMMPGMDGFDLCRKLRQYYEDIPILMLTALDDISHKSKGYELGTDDYLTKPFKSAELVMRIKALLRRYKISYPETLHIGRLAIDHSSHTIFVDGERTDDIAPKEYEVLYKLACSQGKIVSRNEFIKDIWGYDFEGNERTLDVHINRLRERYPTGQCGFKITAIRGIGYRLETTI